MGRCFGILKFLDSIDSAPPQGKQVKTTVDVRIAVKQRRRAVPLDKHGGVTWPTIHPDIVDPEMDGQDTAEALKPAAQGFFVVALTSKSVGFRRTAQAIRRRSFS